MKRSLWITWLKWSPFRMKDESSRLAKKLDRKACGHVSEEGNSFKDYLSSAWVTYDDLIKNYAVLFLKEFYVWWFDLEASAQAVWCLAWQQKDGIKRKHPQSRIFYEIVNEVFPHPFIGATTLSGDMLVFWGVDLNVAYLPPIIWSYMCGTSF